MNFFQKLMKAFKETQPTDVTLQDPESGLKVKIL